MGRPFVNVVTSEEYAWTRIEISDEFGNVMVLQAQTTSADRIRVECVKTHGAAHIDMPAPRDENHRLPRRK